MAAFDPTSAALVLRYVGDGRPISDVPARDLSESDLCRLAYRRALSAVVNDVGKPIDPEHPAKGVITRPDPRKPEQAAVRAIVAELLSRGQFEAVKGENSPSVSAPSEQEG